MLNEYNILFGMLKMNKMICRDKYFHDYKTIDGTTTMGSKL